MNKKIIVRQEKKHKGLFYGIKPLMQVVHYVLVGVLGVKLKTLKQLQKEANEKFLQEEAKGREK